MSPAAVGRRFQGSAFAEAEAALDVVVAVALTAATLPVQQRERLGDAVALGVNAHAAFGTAEQGRYHFRSVL